MRTIANMSSVRERRLALQEFMAKPQTMDAICNSLYLNTKKQVHKDLVRAIVQITGYGKQHVKNSGLIEPRQLLSDGTRSTTFNQTFQALVDRFLIKLRAGPVFFPVLLPDYKGWDDSFWPEDRLQWRNTVEREEIRGAILLMFENIKNHGIVIDLTGAEVYESFTTDDCDDCGSGAITDNDDIVYCDTCHVGHHQSCYAIYPKPGLEDPWNCRVCEASKQAAAHASRKRKSSISSKKATLKDKNVRHKKEEPDYSESHGDSLRTASDIQDAGLPPRKRHSSLNLPQKERYSQNGGRVVSQPPDVQSKPSKSRRTLARIPPLTALTNVPEEDRAFTVKVSSERSMCSIKAPSEDSTPTLTAPFKDGTPSPEPRLSHSQIEGTILLTRLKDDVIFRKVPLTETRTVNALFEMCAQRWPEKFSAGSISRLLYIDDENYLVEIVEGSSLDYIEFLRMIQRCWYNEGMKEVVQVKVLLLAAGETSEL